MSQYLGDISAYALAVSQGYTGTEEEYAELMASYATVGQTAVTAAQTATTKASEAATSATTATNKASEATTAATTATNKAAEAQADADAAALDASQALSAASTATTKASEATTAAATATSAATTATTAKDDAVSAKTAAQTAQAGAETAAASVQSSAAQIQTNADDISELKEDTTQLKSDLSALANIATTWVGANILSPSSIIDGYFISRNDGTLTANAGYFVSDFVGITGGETYTFCEWYEDSAQPQATRYIALFYNADKTPISESYVNSTSGRSITLVAPEQAKYIRVSSTIKNTQISKLAYMLEQASTIDAYAEYETLTVIKDASNILYGKKWVACGDSFTHGYFSGSSDNTLDIGRYKGQNKVYPFFIGNRNNMDIVNEAVNGSTMCLNDGTHNAFSTANGRYTQIPSDADYITLYFGINDGNYSSPIGTINDTDNTTFYGAWNVVLDYLMRNHPYAKIGIIVTNGTSMAYINAEKAIAEKWGIPYLDMNAVQTPVMNRSNNQSIINEVREFRTQVFSVNAPSNTHPSALAHEYESTFIEAFLRRL